MDITNPQILSKYNIIKKLGQGGQGAVYLASQNYDGRLVAIKKVEVKPKGKESLESAIDKALIEIRMLKKVSAEPNCNIYISCYIEHLVEWNNGIIYLVMEFIDGPNLKEYVKPLYETQDSETLVKIIYKTSKAMSKALQEVHAHGILHRDIKPDNIVVQLSTGIPKLVDFGIACQAYAKDDSLCVGPNNDEIGECCVGGGGTFAYLAPERVLYGVRYPQSDIWSLGATMYSLVMNKIIWGDRNFETTTTSMIRQAIMLEEPEKLESGINLLDNLVNGMTKKNISDRITTDKIILMLRDQ